MGNVVPPRAWRSVCLHKGLNPTQKPRVKLNAILHVAHTVRLEVTNPDDIAGLVSYLETTFGKLDMLTLIQSKTLASKGIAVAAAHPGCVKTDLGTQAAAMEVDEGASTVVDLVTVARDQFPHGQLRHKDEGIPW